MFPALRRLGHARPTPRGVALAVMGATLLALGLAAGLADVVGLGTAALASVVFAWVTQGLERLDTGPGALAVVRNVTPDPVVRGERAAVTLTVAPLRTTPAALERLARIRLSEQAAHQLAGHDGVRAHVTPGADRIEVTYAIHPHRRGRWPLGPLLTSRTDAFGLVRTTAPLGDPTTVGVWPRTAELSVHTSLLGQLERTGSGARLTAPDDAVLREYVPGDDPRRIHWPTAARQGRLMVRTDEAAGVRPVTVVLDRGLLPSTGTGRPEATPADGEWAVEHAASLACGFLVAGHPVRFVASSRSTAPRRGGFVAGRSTGRALVLDAAIDLTGHHHDAEADDALVATADALGKEDTPGEVTVAVLRPLGDDALHALSALASRSSSSRSGSCWALVIAHREADARHTVTALRSSGWRTATAAPRTPHDQAWAALAEQAT